MPTAVTHQILAEEVYKSLPDDMQNKIGKLGYYYLGAQGCDILFLYKFISTASDNFGRFLHKNQPLLFFKILFEEAKKDKSVQAYAYGHITHYAADTVFHPYIYGLPKGKKTLVHHAVEHAYDGVFLRKFKGEKLFFYRLPSPKRLNLTGIYNVYARYARESGWGKLQKKAFERAVKYYYALNFTRTPFFKAKNAKRADELFSIAKDRGVRLICAFAKESAEDFAAEDFGRHYLSGKIVTKK